MKSLLLSSAFVLNPLFPSNTPQAKREKILAPYFSPVPGKEVATVSLEERRNHKGNLLDIPGYVWIRPPKGHCFIVTRDPTHLDKRVCKPTRLKFKLGDLTHSGKFSWTIVQAYDDEGTKLTWQTPYRIANYIPLGKFDAGENIRLPIESCKSSFDGITRKIVLTFFDERQWFIPFPPKDQLVEGKKEEKNLFVRVMTSDEDEIGKRHMATKEEIQRRNKLLAMKLSGKYKEKEKPKYTFLMAPWEAYEMNSAYVIELGGPLGMNGKCRYRFKGARFDEESGVIECFNTDNYDALYAHLTCSSTLPERPLAPIQKEDF